MGPQRADRPERGDVALVVREAVRQHLGGRWQKTELAVVVDRRNGYPAASGQFRHAEPNLTIGVHSGMRLRHRACSTTPTFA